MTQTSPALLLALCIAAALPLGCRSSSPSPYVNQPPIRRDTDRAQKLAAEAVDLMEKDSQQAEKLLRDALAADLYHGPSHNNLGVLLLERGDLYEAANEFEWARRLMPGHPDPRMNLALTLEKAGRVDEALAQYRRALEVHPGHRPTVQALTRLEVRAGQADDQTFARLNTLRLEGEDDAWRSWARETLIKLNSVDDNSAQKPPANALK
ncbi:MAG: tetratricopeptide repeat protein [Phycisphaera sp.]|nr:MAG: tetratricopeptide repeat protein [Phycisphaera sp.]